LHGAKTVICPFKRALQASRVVERSPISTLPCFVRRWCVRHPMHQHQSRRHLQRLGQPWCVAKCMLAGAAGGRPQQIGMYVHMCAGHHVPHAGDLPPQTALLALLPPSAAMLFVGYSNPANPTPANPRLLLVKNSWCVKSRFSAKLAMLLHLARVLGWIRALPQSAGHCSWRAAGCTAAAC